MPMKIDHSSPVAIKAIERVNGQPLAILSSHSTFMHDIAAAAIAAHVGEKTSFENIKAEIAGTYSADGEPPDRPEKPFAYIQGIAVIPIHGSLINRSNMSYSFATGYNFIRSQLNMAMADRDVKGIIFDVNSPGGEVAGCFELSQDIAAAAKIKPSIAVVDSACYSAAYALSCAASQIVLSPSAGAGSIGVVTLHVSVEEMIKGAGIEVNFIYAGNEKVAGNMYEALDDKTRSKLQDRVDFRYAEFVDLVANNRGLSNDAVRATEAATYTAADAVSRGLADEVMTPIAAIQEFHSLLNTERSEMNIKTSKDDQAAKTEASDQASTVSVRDLAEAEKRGADSQRARISAIIGGEEAKANPALAQHLAFSTSMSAEDAAATLKAAGPAKAPEKEPAKASNLLHGAMDATGGGAGLQVDGQDPAAEAKDPVGFEAIMASMGRSISAAK